MHEDEVIGRGVAGPTSRDLERAEEQHQRELEADVRADEDGDAEDDDDPEPVGVSVGNGRVERKVIWATIGALLSTLALTLMTALSNEPERLAGLPEWATWVILVSLPTLITFVSGYQARHTNRPDLRNRR